MDFSDRRDLTRDELLGKDLRGAKFIGANLSGFDLHEFDLTDADLSYANLTDTNLTGAILTNANLSIAELVRTNLTDTNLNGVNLEETELNDTLLRNVILTNANLYYANLNNVNLSGANLTGVNLRRTRLFNVNLSGANLSGANFINTTIERCNLMGANLTGNDFRSVNFRGPIQLNNSILTGCNFSDQHFELILSNGGRPITLENVDLSYAILMNVNLSNISLVNVNLRNANLSNSDLNGTDFGNANLTGANLTNAVLSYANLFHTTLNDTNFTDANLRNTIINGNIGVNHTIIGMNTEIARVTFQDPVVVIEPEIHAPLIAEPVVNVLQVHQEASRINVDQLLTEIDSLIGREPEGKYYDFITFIDNTIGNLIRTDPYFEFSLDSQKLPRKEKVIQDYTNILYVIRQFMSYDNFQSNNKRIYGRCIDFAFTVNPQLFTDIWISESAHAYEASHGTTLSCGPGIFERFYLKIADMLAANEDPRFNSIKNIFNPVTFEQLSGQLKPKWIGLIQKWFEHNNTPEMKLKSVDEIKQIIKTMIITDFREFYFIELPDDGEQVLNEMLEGIVDLIEDFKAPLSQGGGGYRKKYFKYSLRNRFL